MPKAVFQEKTYTSEIPSGETIFDHLSRKHDLKSAAARFPAQTGLLHRYEIGVDLPTLATGCRAVIARYGLRGFRNTEDDSDAPAYGSLSLTCNPDRDGDPHSSTLGSAYLKHGQYFYATPQSRAQMPVQKGDYYDTYGFRRLTPAGSFGALGDLLRGFRLPVVRSRLSVIQADRVEASQFSFGWHRDETVFHNLRINIPIWTTPDHLLEIETEREQPDPASTTIQRHHLACGQAYSWDTNKPHRVFTRRAGTQSRCHLVIGLAPWFDYDPEEDSWRPNAYFGKVHPHEIVADALAHPLIGKARGQP